MTIESPCRALRCVALAAVLAPLAGCYATRAEVTRANQSYLPREEARQWFGLNGLVPLSDPAGRQCPVGLARVEAQQSPVDLAIGVGLSLAGAVLGAAACSSDPTAAVGCGYLGFFSLPYLLGSRTVTWSCLPESAPASSAAAR